MNPINSKSHIDITVLKILYFKYKAYVFPSIGFLISFIALTQFVIPQIQTFLSTKDEVIANEQTLATMTQNYNTIVSLNDADLQKNLTIANQALPNVKDFAGILTAISQAAGTAGVIVNDYSFQLGDLASLKPDPNGTSIFLSLTIQGDIEKTKKFLTSLSAQLPLSEVASITLVQDSASMNAIFYYSPSPKFTFDGTTPLPLLTNAQKKVLQKLIANEASTPIISITPTPSIILTPTAAIPTPTLQPTATPSASGSAGI